MRVDASVIVTASCIAICSCSRGSVSIDRGVSQQRTLPPLVSVLPDPVDVPMTGGAVRQQFVEIRRDLITPIAPQALTTRREVSVRFFADMPAFRAVEDSIRQVPDGYLWSGHFVDRDGELRLIDGAGGVYGIARLPKSGDVLILGRDGSRSIAAQGPPDPGIRCALGDASPSTVSSEEPIDAEKVAIDALILYTQEAMCTSDPCDTDEMKQAAAGRLEREVGAWIAEANDWFCNSHVAAALRMIGFKRFAVAERQDLRDMLRELEAPSTHPTAAALLERRHDLSVDVVVVIVSGGMDHGMSQPLPRHGDLSKVGDKAISIVVRAGGSFNYSFAHEIGHLMGAGHQDGSHGLYGFSKAWNDRDEAHTIMATTRGSLWPYFSNPVIEYRPGKTIGSVEADNARTLNLTRGYVANWQPSKSNSVAICKP